MENRRFIGCMVGAAILYYLWRHNKRREATNPALTAVPPETIYHIA